MWITPRFDGDSDTEVARIQHDVYPHALSLIVSKCILYAEFARSLLDDADHPEWGTIDSYDHRTLQGAHDLLAAAWRFRNDFRQTELPFVDQNFLDKVQQLWLGWLRHEISEWLRRPDLVRLVLLILTNQNKSPGYIAEAQLALKIMYDFSDVPWDQKLRKAHKAALEEHREKIEKAIWPNKPL